MRTRYYVALHNPKDRMHLCKIEKSFGKIPDENFFISPVIDVKVGKTTSIRELLDFIFRNEAGYVGGGFCIYMEFNFGFSGFNVDVKSSFEEYLPRWMPGKKITIYSTGGGGTTKDLDSEQLKLIYKEEILKFLLCEERLPPSVLPTPQGGRTPIDFKKKRSFPKQHSFRRISSQSIPSDSCLAGSSSGAFPAMEMCSPESKSSTFRIESGLDKFPSIPELPPAPLFIGKVNIHRDDSSENLPKLPSLPSLPFFTSILFNSLSEENSSMELMSPGETTPSSLSSSSPHFIKGLQVSPLTTDLMSPSIEMSGSFSPSPAKSIKKEKTTCGCWPFSPKYH